MIVTEESCYDDALLNRILLSKNILGEGICYFVVVYL